MTFREASDQTIERRTNAATAVRDRRVAVKERRAANRKAALLAKYERRRRAERRRELAILREPEPVGAVYDAIRNVARKDAEYDQINALHHLMVSRCGSFNLRRARRELGSALVMFSPDESQYGEGLLRGVSRAEQAIRVRVYVRARHRRLWEICRALDEKRTASLPELLASICDGHHPLTIVRRGALDRAKLARAVKAMLNGYEFANIPAKDRFASMMQSLWAITSVLAVGNAAGHSPSPRELRLAADLLERA